MESEKKFDFKLTPAYCAFNKIAVFEQKGSKIVFMIDDLKNFVLRRKIEKAFFEYIAEICAENDCPENFKKNAEVDFVEGTKEELRRAVLKLCENAIDEKNYSSEANVGKEEKFIGEKLLAETKTFFCDGAGDEVEKNKNLNKNARKKNQLVSNANENFADNVLFENEAKNQTKKNQNKIENQTAEKEIKENKNRDAGNEIAKKKDFSEDFFVACNENYFLPSETNRETEKLLDEIIADARKLRATDVHIEKNAIKFRINGVLKNYAELDLQKIEAIARRIKILSGSSAIEKRKIMEGKFSYDKKNPVFINVSILPVFCNNFENSESLVMNLLDSKNVPPELSDLGFNENQLEKIRELERLKSGLILVCALKNAESSATVASILSEIQKINEKKMKIVSLESRPEFFIAEACQIRLESDFFNPPEKFFHILNQDPDAISFGGICDGSAAAAALRAALAGKLVFATLNCENAGDAFLALENFNLNRKLICSALKGVVCQSSDFINEKKNFYADVSLPCEKFAEKIGRNFSETQIDETFSHHTNYSEILNETMEIFRKKAEKSAEENREKKEDSKIAKNRILLGNEFKYNRKKIHKKIS